MIFFPADLRQLLCIAAVMADEESGSDDSEI